MIYQPWACFLEGASQLMVTLWAVEDEQVTSEGAALGTCCVHEMYNDIFISVLLRCMSSLSHRKQVTTSVKVYVCEYEQIIREGEPFLSSWFFVDFYKNAICLGYSVQFSYSMKVPVLLLLEGERSRNVETRQKEMHN